MTMYKLKLTEYQIRALIGVLVWYRNKVIAEGGDTKEVDEILLLALDCSDKKKS